MDGRQDLEQRVAELEKRLSGLSASGTRRGYRGIRKRASWGIGDLPWYEIAIAAEIGAGRGDDPSHRLTPPSLGKRRPVAQNGQSRGVQEPREGHLL
jgi:hypothetical protein